MPLDTQPHDARRARPGSATTTWSGHGVTRYDAPDKVTGRAKYTADIRLPGMIVGKILGSPIAHGIITRIDVSKARALPRRARRDHRRRRARRLVRREPGARRRADPGQGARALRRRRDRRGGRGGRGDRRARAQADRGGVRGAAGGVRSRGGDGAGRAGDPSREAALRRATSTRGSTGTSATWSRGSPRPTTCASSASSATAPTRRRWSRTPRSPDGSTTATG